MRTPLLLLSVLYLINPAMAAPPLMEPIRVGPGEQAALFSPDVRFRSLALLEALQSAPQAPANIDALQRFAQDTGLGAVQRDAALYDLIDRLRQMPSDSIPPQALEWLQNHSPLAVRVHDESVHFEVPLFNVAGSARGLENQWRFVSAERALQSGNTDQLESVLASYRDNVDSPEARGLRAVLNAASEPALLGLASHCAGDAHLTAHLLPHVQMALGDFESLAQWLPLGDPSRVNAVLLAAQDNGYSALFEAALQHPDAGSRGLAMARVTDALLSQKRLQPQWNERLWQLMDDPQMASTAALQLARIDASQPLSQFQALEDDDESGQARLSLIRQLQRSLPTPASEPKQ